MTRWEFEQKQSLPYEAKVKLAARRANEFYDEIVGNRGANVHVSVGGLDSITLLLFLRSIGLEVEAISVSALEDKSIQAVHKQLGVQRISPGMRQVDVLNKFGFPVISKAKAKK